MAVNRRQPDNFALMGLSEASLRLNPRLPPSEAQELTALFEQWQKPGDIWLASSGSSRTSTESLKLIALTVSGLHAAAQAGNRYLQASSADRWLQTLPEFHIGGLMIGMRASSVGAAVIQASFEKWSAGAFHRQLIEDKISLASLVPTQLFDLVQERLSPPAHLRAILVGGAALEVGLEQKVRALGWPILPGYGLTEAGALVAGAPLSSVFAGDFAVLDHVEVALNAEGLLQLRGPSLLRGWAQIRDGRHEFHEHPAGTWWTTSDRAEIRRDETGAWLKILGRLSDFVKIKGEGVDMGRLRQILSEIAEQLGGSAESLWLEPVLDERAGHALVLVHEPFWNGERLRQLRSRFQALVLPFENWQRDVAVAQIPRTALMKIDRVALLNLLR